MVHLNARSSNFYDNHILIYGKQRFSMNVLCVSNYAVKIKTFVRYLQQSCRYCIIDDDIIDTVDSKKYTLVECSNKHSTIHVISEGKYSDTICSKCGTECVSDIVECSRHTMSDYSYISNRICVRRTDKNDIIDSNISKLLSSNKTELISYMKKLAQSCNKKDLQFITHMYIKFIDDPIMTDAIFDLNIKRPNSTVKYINEIINRYIITGSDIPRNILRMMLPTNKATYGILDEYIVDKKLVTSDDNYDMLWELRQPDLDISKLPRSLRKYEQRYNTDFMNTALKQPCSTDGNNTGMLTYSHHDVCIMTIDA